MFQEAERLKFPAWVESWDKTKTIGTLLKSRDEQLKLIAKLESLSEKQMVLLLEILKRDKLLQNIQNSNREINNWLACKRYLIYFWLK